MVLSDMAHPRSSLGSHGCLHWDAASCDGAIYLLGWLVNRQSMLPLPRTGHLISCMYVKPARQRDALGQGNSERDREAHARLPTENHWLGPPFGARSSK
jgi:hypothetical protein